MDDMSEPNKHLTRAPLSTPLVPANRLVELDILRGLALFGVMAINLVLEFLVSIFEQFLPLNEIASPLDRAVEAPGSSHNFESFRAILATVRRGSRDSIRAASC